MRFKMYTRNIMGVWGVWGLISKTMLTVWGIQISSRSSINVVIVPCILPYSLYIVTEAAFCSLSNMFKPFPGLLPPSGRFRADISWQRLSLMAQEAGLITTALCRRLPFREER